MRNDARPFVLRADAGRGGTPPPIRSSLGRNLTHGMLDALGRSIVKGEFSARAFPTEADLARHFAVSRTVTREAVKMLTAKGLLSARPRQGTVVEPEAAWNLFDADVLRWLLERKFSLSLLRQFSELRASIEPAAADLAACNVSPERLALVDAGYRRMERADAGDGDPLEADIAFHVAILDASGNPFYAQFRDVVETALRTSIRFTNRFKGHIASLPAHKAVRDGIATGKGAKARRAMRAIIDDVMRLIADAERGSGGVP
jgi:DNA-binding FadR family transcriptional regulator